MPEFVTLVLRDGLADVLSSASRTILEGESLPAYLPKRRWFAAKDRDIDEIRIARATPLPGTDLILAQVETTAGGTTDCYQVPLGIVWEDGGLPALQQQLAVARVRRGRRVGFLTDAFSLRDLPLALVEGLRTGRTLQTEDGEIRFRPTTRMEGFELPPDIEIQWLATEQSNSSLVLGDKLVLKVIRRIRPGIHPEAEMGRHLTEHGVGNIAPLFGEVVRIGADGTIPPSRPSRRMPRRSSAGSRRRGSRSTARSPRSPRCATGRMPRRSKRRSGCWPAGTSWPGWSSAWPKRAGGRCRPGSMATSISARCWWRRATPI
jgi:maltose alpha-D-glucosyltransferase/alpha-amylase